MSRDPLTAPPVDEEDVAGWTAALGLGFASLVYPHKPDMTQWLNGWIAGFAAAVPEALPTATCYPEPGVAGYLEMAVSADQRG